ncbi:MAG: hypothetical protein FD170_3899 [Bacteroidetes bacterium]|nr:MAG: hypothetical protein FD170_3899 [Bacteroidota bacterium]
MEAFFVGILFSKLMLFFSQDAIIAAEDRCQGFEPFQNVEPGRYMLSS